MIGLDTSAIIDLFKGNKDLRKKINQLNTAFASSQISYMELMFGINHSNLHHTQEESYYDSFFETVELLPLDNSSCKLSSKIFWNLKLKGKMLDQIDCTIAASLLSKGINTIITKNKKHFERIPGLKVISY